LVSWLVEPIVLEDVVVGGQYIWAAGDRGPSVAFVVCRARPGIWDCAHPLGRLDNSE